MPIQIEPVDEVLRSAPVESEEFKQAMIGFRRLCATPNVLYRAIERCYELLYDRFGRNEHAFAELVAEIGDCAAVCLFLEAIVINDDGPADGEMSAANAFAYKHFATCARCRGRFNLMASVRTMRPPRGAIDARLQ
jgi:hypothetical protein